MDDESLDELRRIFEVTGGKEFMDKIEEYSAQKAKEDGMDIESYFLHAAMDNNGTHGGNHTSE